MSVTQKRLNELLYQALETEKGGIVIYETALRCVRNDDLKKEWTKYLDQTRRHEEIVVGLLESMALDPFADTPGRTVVRHIGKALVGAMDLAIAAGDAKGAEIVAGECVVLAETKDHMNWKLLGECAEKASGTVKKALKDACDEVAEEEDEHLYHSNGWTRELWLDALGIGGVFPPPEEQRDVKTAIGAARAEQDRGSMRSE